MKDGLNQGELMRTKNKSRQQNVIITESKKISSNFQSGGGVAGAGTDEGGFGVKSSNLGGTARGSLKPLAMAGLSAAQGGNISQVGSLGQNSFNSGVAGGSLTSNASIMMNTNVVSQKHQFNNNTQYLKHIIKHGDIVNFYIKKKWGADLPVNHKDQPHQSQKAIPNHEKIERILMAKKKSKLDILPSLTGLYDEELNENPRNEATRSEDEIKREKNKKRAYIDEMLSM